MLIQTIRATVWLGLALFALGVLHPNSAVGQTLQPAAAFELQDLQGQTQILEQESEGLTVICFLGTECPLAKLYAGRLQTLFKTCLLYTSPSPRDATLSRMPSSA